MTCPTSSMPFLNLGRYRAYRRDSGRLRDSVLGLVQPDPEVERATQGMTGPVRLTLRMIFPPPGGTEMSNKEQLVAKMTAHINAHFGGDWRAAFDAHDADHDGVISDGELRAILMAVGVGTVLTRQLWVRGILKELDANGDGRISWEEFAAVLKPA